MHPKVSQAHPGGLQIYSMELSNLLQGTQTHPGGDVFTWMAGMPLGTLNIAKDLRLTPGGF